MGWLRIIMLEDFNYQEHASEYGTHWNFFTTIAVVAFLQNFFISSRLAIGTGVTILLVY